MANYTTTPLQFGSRVGLVDEICDSLDLSAVEASPDVATLLRRTTDLWAREETFLSQLYDAAAVDPAAREFVAGRPRIGTDTSHTGSTAPSFRFSAT